MIFSFGLDWKVFENQFYSIFFSFDFASGLNKKFNNVFRVATAQKFKFVILKYTQSKIENRKLSNFFQTRVSYA